ncbi:MAG: response regulator [Lachnospiraceae bacterium]|nr:response regulator [Lachnospiraceae bacterium]
MSKILLIDDDEDMLAMTGRWLEKAGYEVMRAASGKDALSLLETSVPDLILLDYAMPEMDGPAVLSAIREREALASVPVLYRTGMDEMQEAGAPAPDGIVPKSEGKPGLLKAVSSFLLGHGTVKK